MRDTASVLGSRSGLPDDERIRALELVIPKDHVQAVLAQTGHDARRCPVLPHWFVAWMVIGFGLFSKDSQRQVFKRLQRFRPGATPSRSTVAEARKGLGAAPMRLLARRSIRLLGSPGTRGAFRKGMRLMALDSFVFDLADTEANEEAFGRPESGRAPGAFPQARVLALCETGSRVLWRWQVKPCCRSEAVMAPVLLRHLEPDMLLLWDRGFLSHKLVQQVLGRGAHLLARVKKSFVLEPEEVLPDGSFLTTLRPPRGGRAAREAGGVRVRVIEYAITGTGHKDDGETHRLLTTLLDHEEHPAEELIVLYHERWEEETAFDELKTHLKERPVLRSQSPTLAVQEMDGLMLAHFAVRAVIQEAAEAEGLDPDQVSFTGTLTVLRCRLPELPKGAGEETLKQWWKELLAEVAEETIPPRRYRFNPRVVKRKMSGWEKKKPRHRRPPKPSKTFRESITIQHMLL